MNRTVVFVHGWSVQNTDTYGRLPERLIREAAERGVTLDARNLWLSRYVSFRDEVRLPDVSRGFAAAVERELGDLVARGERFACITHSTGGPVVRDWWHRYYLARPGAPPCPMSHLVMLAPANFGSALAQLGKARLGRIKAWFNGVEPGSGVLDWLELGSPESFSLNRAWIETTNDVVERTGVYPCVLTGQTIDAKLYDHLNSYTGEPGSDGVVRVAAANLNAAYVRLEQEAVCLADGEPIAPKLTATQIETAPPTAFKIVPGRSHSGREIGILRSVMNDGRPHPTVDAVLACLEVSNPAEYHALRERFFGENHDVQEAERARVHDRVVLHDTVTITDRYAMIVFRVLDETGQQIGSFDLKLTATSPTDPGRAASPDLLPKGFFGDRQRNHRHPATLTYFLDADVMRGSPEVRHPDQPDRVIRPALPGTPALGLTLEPHAADGFVHFLEAGLVAREATLESVVTLNQTTLVDIVMRRVVREGVFRMDRDSERSDRDFSKDDPGPPLGVGN